MSDEDQEKERLNRKLIELLNELRIAIPGVQVLFAFLLILPFNTGFVEADDLGRAVYAGSLSCAAVASALPIGPAALPSERSSFSQRFDAFANDGPRGIQTTVSSSSRRKRCR